MPSTKLVAGAAFPEIKVKSLEGEDMEFGKPRGDADWRMAIVYRGRHCPLCTKFLNKLDGYIKRLLDVGIALDIVSGDSKEQLEEHLTRLEVSFPIYYGLTVEQMKILGLYISHPRSEKETDHPFAEPGMFILNEKGTLQAVDISNNPWARPDLEVMVSGLEWIRSNNYPIRGTYE